MDEPTTALTGREVRRLLDIIRKLKDEGVAVVFVSHKLAEVLQVSEKVVVLRNGRKVAEGPAADFRCRLADLSHDRPRRAGGAAARRCPPARRPC